MLYETMPLYPGMRPPAGEKCVRLPLFETPPGHPGRPPAFCECERVTLENPCRPGERAEVALGVDPCGSLVVCVRRRECCPDWDRPPCRPCCDPPPRRGLSCPWPEPCERPIPTRCRKRRPPVCGDRWNDYFK